MLQDEYKLDAPTKQKPLDNTTIAEDINRISLLLRKHLLSTQIQELSVHVTVHQTPAESQAQQVRYTFIFLNIFWSLLSINTYLQ